MGTFRCPKETSSPPSAARPNSWGGPDTSTCSLGARIERNIDPKRLRREGAFVDDITLTIKAAKARLGVAVYTCDDIGQYDKALTMAAEALSAKNADDRGRARACQ